MIEGFSRSHIGTTRENNIGTLDVVDRIVNGTSVQGCSDSTTKGDKPTLISLPKVVLDEGALELEAVIFCGGAKFIGTITLYKDTTYTALWKSRNGVALTSIVESIELQDYREISDGSYTINLVSVGIKYKQGVYKSVASFKYNAQCSETIFNRQTTASKDALSIKIQGSNTHLDNTPIGNATQIFNMIEEGGSSYIPNAIPIGTIIAYGQSLENNPILFKNGGEWALCDGKKSKEETNGIQTPNLINYIPYGINPDSNQNGSFLQNFPKTYPSIDLKIENREFNTNGADHYGITQIYARDGNESQSQYIQWGSGKDAIKEGTLSLNFEVARTYVYYLIKVK